MAIPNNHDPGAWAEAFITDLGKKKVDVALLQQWFGAAMIAGEAKSTSERPDVRALTEICVKLTSHTNRLGELLDQASGTRSGILPTS